MNRSMFVIAAAAALLVTGAAQAQDFDFGIDGCPARLSGNPGDPVTFDAFVTLTTANNTGTDGAQGWSLSVEVSGGVMQKASLKGVIVSTIYDEDDDGEPSTPPIHHDPFDFDLDDAFTDIANKATFKDDPLRGGAISAVVLKSQEKMVLQPNGKVQILKLTINGAIPAEGCAPLTISFTDGFKSSVSQPVNNVVTFGGASVKPVLTGCTVQLCAIGPEFHLAIVEPGKTPPLSGDSELTGSFPPGDVIVPVDVLLSSVNLPPAGDGAQGWSLSIAHDACMTVSKVTLKGVTVSTIYDEDDDGEPSTPPIHHDPFEFDLSDAFTDIANLATGEPPSPVNDANVKGVISAVVMKSQEKMVLHPNATDTVLRISYKVTVEANKTTNCRAFFLNGLKSSVSQPVNTVITFGGASIQPALQQGLVIKLFGSVGPVDGAEFKSGDANNDGKFNIADAVRIVMAVVPSIGPPLPCPASGDVDGNGRTELPDAVYIIDWQFLQGSPPVAPFPACALREDVTELTCPLSYLCTQ